MATIRQQIQEQLPPDASILMAKGAFLHGTQPDGTMTADVWGVGTRFYRPGHDQPPIDGPFIALVGYEDNNQKSTRAVDLDRPYRR